MSEVKPYVNSGYVVFAFECGAIRYTTSARWRYPDRASFERWFVAQGHYETMKERALHIAAAREYGELLKITFYEPEEFSTP